MSQPCSHSPIGLSLVDTPPLIGLIAGAASLSVASPVGSAGAASDAGVALDGDEGAGELPEGPEPSHTTDPEVLWQADLMTEAAARLPDNRPWFVSPPPSEEARLAWEDTFLAVAPEAEDLRVAPLSDETLRAMLHAFGFSDDLDRLRRSAEGHSAARAWLRSAQVAARLSAAGQTFAAMHAPAIWARLLPGRPCLEGLHITLMQDLEDPLRRPLHAQLCAAQTLVRLLPASVTTTREADLWLGPTSALAGWVELTAEAPIVYGCAEDREDHLAALAAVRCFLERFPDERATRRRAWRLLQAQLRWRLGEVEQARAEFQAEIQARPSGSEADCAWATVVGGQAFGEVPTVRRVQGALAVLAQARRRRLSSSSLREVRLLEAEYRDHLDFLVPSRVPAGCASGTRLLRLLHAEAAEAADAAG